MHFYYGPDKSQYNNIVYISASLIVPSTQRSQFTVDKLTIIIKRNG